MESLQAWGIQLIQSIQVLSPALDSIMEVFTFLGTVNFYILFITFIYWVVDARLGFRVFMLLMTIDVFGSALKQLLHQPRPYWIGDVKQMSIELNYGIPSTHASNTLSVWGYLAFQLKKRWLWILAIFLVLLIGISRLYLGVHFPHDVVGGWLIGLLVLILSGPSAFAQESRKEFIIFSHELHIDGMGVECMACHEDITKSKRSSDYVIPSYTECFVFHSGATARKGCPVLP